MPLYDVTYGYRDAALLEPKQMEQSMYVHALRRKLVPATFTRVIQTVEEAIADTVQNKRTLVWASAGSLFGYQSGQPLKHVNHLWEKIIQCVGDGKNCLLTVGTLLRWQIALRSEMWLLDRQETDDVDPDTGKLITISNYWINDKFQPPKTHYSMDDLKAKWR